MWVRAALYWYTPLVSYNRAQANYPFDFGRMHLLGLGLERPEAWGDGDWALVGDIPGLTFSILAWYCRLQRFHGHRSDRAALFFLDPDMRRPLVYRVALEQFKARQPRVGIPEEELAGLHGLRVEGYSGTESVLGADVAQAHGLWKSMAVKRYARFALGMVARIPAAIVGVDPAAQNEPSSERAAGPPAQRLTRDSLRDHSERSAAPSASVLLPPGWTRFRHDGVHLSQPYVTYRGPNGERAQSRVQAWRVADEAEDLEVGSVDDVTSALAAEEDDGEPEDGGAPRLPLVQEQKGDSAPAGVASTSPTRRAESHRRNGRWVSGGSPPTPESGPIYVDELVTEFDRPSLRRPPSRVFVKFAHSIFNGCSPSGGSCSFLLRAWRSAFHFGRSRLTIGLSASIASVFSFWQ